MVLVARISPERGVSRRLRLFGACTLVFAALVASGCSRCSSKGTGDDAGAATRERHDLSLPPTPGAPAFTALPAAGEFGLPRGCALAGPVRRASLAAPRVRFLASRRELSSLALATSGQDSGTLTEAAGAVDFAGGGVEALPWGELESPPLLDRAAGRWVSAWTLSGAPGHTRVLLWRGGAHAETLAEGDQLTVADLSCSGDECAVLTSLVREAASPGATLLVGRLEGASFSRVDIEPGGEAWLPFAIAEPDDESKRFVALVGPKQTALYRVADGRAEKQVVVETPYGSFDAVATPTPTIVAPGLAPDVPCPGRDFPIVVSGADGKRREVGTPAAPESLLARPLAKGALVAWVAPVSCVARGRRVVYAMLLDADGAPASTPMAIADASGFALATRGQRASLWLRQGGDVSWLDLTCAPETDRDAGAAPSTPGSK